MKMDEKQPVTKVKPVPIIDLLIPLLDEMSEEELEELYDDLTNK